MAFLFVRFCANDFTVCENFVYTLFHRVMLFFGLTFVKLGQGVLISIKTMEGL